MTDFIYAGMLLGSALAGIGTAFGIWAAYRYSTTRSDSHFVALLFWLIGLSALLVEAFATRSAAVTASVIDGSSGLVSAPTFASAMLGKATVPFIVGLASVRFILGTFKSQNVFTGVANGDKADPARYLFYAYLFYFTCSGFLNSLAGTQPAFVHWTFYPVLIIGAAYFSRSVETTFLVKHAKWILLALIYLSLLAAIISLSRQYTAETVMSKRAFAL